MNLMFRERNLKGVEVDADTNPYKHDSVALRELHSTWHAGHRQRFITCRRLDEWLISDWFFKRDRLQLHHLDFEPVLSGLFFSLRLGGTWVAADWWIHYFALDGQVITLRLNELHSDLNHLMLPQLPEGTAPFATPPHVNAKSTPMDFTPTLTKADRRRIAAVNPDWTAWQARIYGEGLTR